MISFHYDVNRQDNKHHLSIYDIKDFHSVCYQDQWQVQKLSKMAGEN